MAFTAKETKHYLHNYIHVKNIYCRYHLQMQNLRSKMKRKLDTKASKGRKLRYAFFIMAQIFDLPNISL